MNELKIKGISYASGENLHGIFELISKIIGYDLTSPNHRPELNRMQKRNATVSEFVPLP